MSKDFEENKKNAFLEWLDSDGELGFDMYSQDPTDWDWLKQFVPTLIIKSAGGLCPFQAEGYIFNLPFYYRERHGWASLELGEEEALNGYSGDSLFSSGIEVEEFRSGPGWISTLLTLIEKLEKSDFLYYFSGNEVKWEDPNDVNTAYIVGDYKLGYPGRGANPEEAYRNSIGIWEFLVERGWKPEDVQKLVDLQDIKPVPKNEDRRIFPNPIPEFKVSVPELWRLEDGTIELPREMFREEN